MNIWSLLVIVALAEGFLHYVPWRLFLRGRELPRLAAYLLGVLGMTVPLTAYLWLNAEHEIIVVLWAVTGTAGLVVIALYGFDRYQDLVMKDIEASEREAVRGKKS